MKIIETSNPYIPEGWTIYPALNIVINKLPIIGGVDFYIGVACYVPIRRDGDEYLIPFKSQYKIMLSRGLEQYKDIIISKALKNFTTKILEEILTIQEKYVINESLEFPNGECIIYKIKN